MKYGRYNITEMIFYRQLSGSLGNDLMSIATQIHLKNKEADYVSKFKYGSSSWSRPGLKKPIKAYIIHNTKTYTWLMMTLTEGKNREIRNIFESLNLTVTRLIRVSYGKYKLGNLPKGIVKNIKL